MTAIAVASAPLYIHPHHGVADVEGLSTNSRGVEVLTLSVRRGPDIWDDGDGDRRQAASAAASRVSVPVAALESGDVMWGACPRFDVDRVLALVESLEEPPWRDDHTLNDYASVALRCRSEIRSLVWTDEPEYVAASIFAQVGDFMTDARARYVRNELTRVRATSPDVRRAVLLQKEIQAGTGPFWIELVAKPVAARAGHGRELNEIMLVLVSIVAAGSTQQMDEAELIQRLDVALSGRTRRARRAVAA